MKQHQHRGAARIVILMVIILMSLSGLARCDIEQSRAHPHHTTDPEDRHALDDTIISGGDLDLDRTSTLR